MGTYSAVVFLGQSQAMIACMPRFVVALPAVEVQRHIVVRLMEGILQVVEEDIDPEEGIGQADSAFKIMVSHRLFIAKQKLQGNQHSRILAAEGTGIEVGTAEEVAARRNPDKLGYYIVAEQVVVAVCCTISFLAAVVDTEMWDSSADRLAVVN